MNRYKVFIGGQAVYIDADSLVIESHGGASFYANRGMGTKALAVYLAPGTFTMIERVDLSDLFPEVK